jgi:transcriptional regulator with XRE-family HTH domain
MTLEAIESSRSVPFASDAAPCSESTSTFVPSSAGGMRVLRNIRPRQERQCQFSFDLAVFMPIDPWVIIGKTLIEKACLNAFVYNGKGTTAPQPIRLYWPKDESEWRETRPAKPKRASGTTAQMLLEDVRKRSGLTLEELAPLVGVSRRSLQHWRAGAAMSARKEQRLRDLADSLQALGQKDAGVVRQLLFERTTYGVRPYDLISEGRFDAAYTAIIGRDAPAHIVKRSTVGALPLAPPLLARISIRDDGPVGTSGQVDLRRSRRLKR